MPNDCACNKRVFFFFSTFSGTFLLLLHRLPWLCSRRCISRAFTYVCVCVCARVPAFVCVVCFAVRSLVVCFCLVAVVSFGSRFFFFFAYFFTSLAVAKMRLAQVVQCSVNRALTPTAYAFHQGKVEVFSERYFFFFMLLAAIGFETTVCLLVEVNIATCLLVFCISRHLAALA